MMFLGRVVLGAVAERVGPSPLLGAAVAVVSVGCALMAAPGPGLVAVAGLMVVGFGRRPDLPAVHARPRAERVGASGATRMVSLQVAASAAGSAAAAGRHRPGDRGVHREPPSARGCCCPA